MAEYMVSLPSEEGMSENTAGDLQKYRYPEFAGWSGERYLKKLLRQILPMSLYRTWEIFVDHQAQGNDCYLGVTHLAEIAGRATRTMEKNLASLCAKRLLVERAERKLFRSAEGKTQSRVVIVKDFGGLYALAHDYHEWLHGLTYIAPDREMMVLVEQDPPLVARVRRFENYRRLLYTRLPGPAVKQREEDRWFTEYQPAPSCDVPPTYLGKEVEPSKRDRIPSTLSAKDLTTDLATSSLKRKSESATMNWLGRDSVDSMDLSLTCSFGEREPSNFEHDEEHLSEAEHDTHRPDHSIAEEETTILTGPDLAASFLSVIVGPFRDRNPKGSQTRLRALLREAHLAQPAEALQCLVRAYIVARDTHTIRPAHCSPTGQVNRMPLFFAMVQQFLGEQGRAWDDPWQHLEEEIIADPCLARWWNEHQGQIHFPSRSTSDVSEAASASSEAFKADEYADQEGTPRSHRLVRLSQTNEEREERVALAHRVLRRLVTMAVPIQDAYVLWEHITCGCPLYHRSQRREVCALCFPDPDWPEEALVLLQSIVEGGKNTTAPFSEGLFAENAYGEGDLCEETRTGWADRDDAYDEARRVLDALTRNGYMVEVCLELIGEGYQIVVRGADGELICMCPEQVEYLIGQAQDGML
jgi:hypothetical protein